MDKVCACGCGNPAQGTWVKGHNPKVKGSTPRRLVPEIRVCEECGREYHRGELRHPQSNRHWLQRRFCGETCRRAWTSRWAASRKGEVRKVDATPQAGRKRARALYGAPHPCEVCGAKAERHHKDGNTLNNDPSNIAFLCRKHHIQAEDRMAYRRKDPVEQAAHKRALARERARRYRERKRAAA